MIEALVFVGAWGAMMAAMMLPSAAPMILLYGTVSRRLSQKGDAVLPATVFTGVYLLVWLLFGIPVYAGYAAIGYASAASSSFATVVPYAVAATLVGAGLYQFSNLKRVCLRYCEAPLPFLMRRWRSGYRATARLAFDHAAYCVGCCWALMVILVVAGAMSIPWVIAIAITVFVEKLLPRRHNVSKAIGIALILLGLAVTVRPDLARTLRGAPMEMRM